MMNPYFTPKVPEPRTGAFDIILRAMICVIVVLTIGVGIWTTIDVLHGKAATNHASQNEWAGRLETNAVVQAPDSAP